MEADSKTMDRPLPKRVRQLRRMKRTGIALAAIGAVAGTVVWLSRMAIPTVEAETIVISPVDRGNIDVSVTATGRIVPAFEEVIVSPISSRILEVYAQSGDSVEVGTPLLRLDLQAAETDYAKALDEREIRLQQLVQLQTNTETQLSDRQMQIEVEEMKVSGLEAQLRNELYLDSLGSGTRDRVRQAETALRTAQLQLRQLRQQLSGEQKVRQADLRMQQLQMGIFDKSIDEKRCTLSDAKICSPRRATLTYIFTEVGSTVSVGQKVAIVSDLTHFKAECEISDSHSERVRVGGAVILKVGKQRLGGTISTVTPLSQSGAITFTVLPADPSHPRLHSGLRAEVFVITSTKEDILRIRNGSFYSGPGQYTLYTVEGDQLLPRQVKLGECNYDYIEVLEGLTEGDRAVVSDMTKYAGHPRLKLRQKR